MRGECPACVVTRLHEHCIDALIVEESSDTSELPAWDHEGPELAMVYRASPESVGLQDLWQDQVNDRDSLAAGHSDALSSCCWHQA